MDPILATFFFLAALIGMFYWLGGLLTVVKAFKAGKLESITVVAFTIVTGFVIATVWAGMSFL